MVRADDRTIPVRRYWSGWCPTQLIHGRRIGVVPLNNHSECRGLPPTISRGSTIGAYYVRAGVGAAGDPTRLERDAGVGAVGDPTRFEIGSLLTGAREFDSLTRRMSDENDPIERNEDGEQMVPVEVLEAIEGLANGETASKEDLEEVLKF